MTLRYWADLPSAAFRGLHRQRTVAVLPLAATEQHGPHLPTGTDSIIADGLLRETALCDLGVADVIVLPIQEVGASLEHAGFPGTVSLSAAQMIEVTTSVGASVAAAGIGKLVLVSSHGGNVATMTAAALECRARHHLLAVTLTWERLGLPEGLISEHERQFGIHGGAVETSLMLHFRPDLVDIARAADFSSRQQELAGRYRYLRAHGPVGFGWLAGDLNPQGTTGNAGSATREIGAAIAAHRASAFATLLAEVAGETFPFGPDPA